MISLIEIIQFVNPIVSRYRDQNMQDLQIVFSTV